MDLRQPTATFDGHETCQVAVEMGGDSTVPDDLLARLSANLSMGTPGPMQEVIFEPSQVVAFHLKNSRSDVKATHVPFKYPKSIFMDQFLSENAELAKQKQLKQRELSVEIQKLVSKRKSFTSHNVSSFPASSMDPNFPTGTG